MAKYTLLEIVQDVLNDLDGDEVNSIDDTIESEQVSYIVRSTYNALMSSRDWPHTRKLVNLVASGDSSLPTHMTLSSPVKRLVFINYNWQKSGETKKHYQPVKYLYPDEFLRLTNNRNNDADNCDIIVDPTGIELFIINDKNPEYFTSFDEETIVFDSYDSEVDTTLQESKVQAMAYLIPSFSLNDTFVPDLPEEAFPLLIEEAKSKTSMKLRQTPDQKSEQEATRQDRYLSRNSWRVKGGIRTPNYGRK